MNGIEGASGTRLRRALLIDAGSAARLQPQLAVNGYETRTATTGTAAHAIEEFEPHVLLIELRRGGVDGGGSSQDCLALARKLRAEPATYVLPLVFVFDEDERDLRNAALSVGADDYFSVWTPAAEMLARLDALFWRTEAGRRAASVAGDQRLEIDNFIMMLDSVRAALRAGDVGTLALVYATPARAVATLDKAARDRTLAEAHGFLKLNLRRVDEVTFYGPTTLLVYLPRTASETAQAALSRLREQFIAERAGFEIALGLASFPTDGDDVESLIERAEAAALRARDLSRTERVAVYSAKDEAEDKSEARQETQPPLFAPVAETSNAVLMEKVDERQAIETNAGESLAFEKQAGESGESVVSSSTSTGEISPASSSSSSPVSTRPAKSAKALRGAAQLNGAEALKAASEAGARELERRASGAIMPRRLLLTVSDAARMAQINALIRSAGYEARAAFDGQQALDLLRIERPDLLLLDYQLQGMDGVETLRRLRKQGGGNLKLPVILLLPQDQELARREALELGARDVVITPYDPAELLTSVRLAGNAE
ncbi:MAG: two-component system, OmpR family, response regulator AdeR [Blastocatellia bacterium]|jgi:PleD family two-component response regulator|nr:two-component system, OmpR family, response regulator AdeR [Blastocatellia bacterium]